MGNTQPQAASDPLVATASRAFSRQELHDLKSAFDSIADLPSSPPAISLPGLLSYYGICGPIGPRLFQLVSRGQAGISFENLLITKATYVKGSTDEIEAFIYQLCDIDGDGHVKRSDLELLLESVNETTFSGNKDGSGTSNKKIEAFVATATFSDAINGTSERAMSLQDFRNWCHLLPSLRKFLGSLLIPPNSGRAGFQIPHIQYPGDINHELLVLNELYAWHIGGGFSQQEFQEWRLLYHSALHGLSFSTFLSNVSITDGPTVLIVKDSEGFVYGGFASQLWEKHNNFYGDMKSFLFQLYPKASIFRATGANSNLQWCGVNFSSEGIPNGIGFGGRPNHFGLFVSASFDQGHTFMCTTFNSPCLSMASSISPEVIECWGIQMRGAQSEKSEFTKGTVLDRFKEDRNMLKMVGLANSSD